MYTCMLLSCAFVLCMCMYSMASREAANCNSSEEQREPFSGVVASHMNRF